MEFRSHFYESSKSRNGPKSINDVMHTNLNCKSVKVTEVIEKVNSKKSGRKSHPWRRRNKKN